MPQPHSRKEKSTDCKPISSWHDALWLSQFTYQRLTYWGNISTLSNSWPFLGVLPITDSNEAREPVVLQCLTKKKKRREHIVAQSVAYTQQRGLEGLGFWKDAWLQPHFKERSALHTPSVDTRTTDMEKMKELASCWHCSFTQLSRGA